MRDKVYVIGLGYVGLPSAVAHHQFKALTDNDYKKLSKDEPIVSDIKNIVKNPSWRL